MRFAEVSWLDPRAEEAAKEATEESANEIRDETACGGGQAPSGAGEATAREVTMARGPGERPDDEPEEPDDAEQSDESEEADELEDFAAAPDADDTDGTSEEEEETSEDAEELPSSTVFVATATPLQVSVAPLPDERAPDGVCLASRIDGRLVARCAMPGESIERLMELQLFEEPVLIGLLAYEAEPGIQARLVALVPAARLTEGGEEDEPWKASVPSFEQSQREAAEAGDEGEGEGAGLAAILLGHIVRFTRDRKHPEDLAREAVDILQRVVSGSPLSDAAAKAIDDLLDSL